jgi:hypothetical protein
LDESRRHNDELRKSLDRLSRSDSSGNQVKEMERKHAEDVKAVKHVRGRR